MKVTEETHFVRDYFDNKSGEALLRTITPDWRTTTAHLASLNIDSKCLRIVEIGCGVGRLLEALHTENRERELLGIDASVAMINEARKRASSKNLDYKLVGGDGGSELLEDTKLHGVFHTAFSIITFQHIPNTITVHNYLRAMRKMLAPGGELVFQVLARDMGKGFLWTYHPIPNLLSLLSGELEMTEVSSEERGVWVIIRAKRTP